MTDAQFKRKLKEALASNKPLKIEFVDKWWRKLFRKLRRHADPS